MLQVEHVLQVAQVPQSATTFQSDICLPGFQDQLYGVHVKFRWISLHRPDQRLCQIVLQSLPE